MKRAEPRLHPSPVRQMRADGGLTVNHKCHEPDAVTASIIERCRAQGMRIDQCARIVGMSPHSIEKYYSDEYEAGTSSLIQEISRNMATIALDPGHKQTVVAGKFMLSRLAPDVFAERSVIQYLDRNGRATDPNAATVLDPYQMTDEQRDALRGALAAVLKDAVDEAAEHKLSRDAIDVETIEYHGDDVDYEEVTDGNG